MTHRYIIAPDNIYLSAELSKAPWLYAMDNSPIYWPVSEANLILYTERNQRFLKAFSSQAACCQLNKYKHMVKQKFKPGDKVKFTQEAKDRFDDREYWHCANYPRLDLDGIYTVKGYSTKNWPSYSLKEDGTAPHIADYLLEPAETEQTKKKNMTKKDFILALVQAIFPDQDITYEGCKPYVKVHSNTDTIIVKCSKYHGNVHLTLSPMYGYFEETDIELVTKFLEQNCGLDCPEDTTQVTDNGDLVICFADYPWHMIDEIKSSTPEEPVQEEEQPSPCDNCSIVRKLQAEIQRLKYELDQAKAEKSRVKASPRKGQPWMEKFDLPDGGHGIAFGFSF